MNFEQVFKRSVGANTFPALGSDAAPSAPAPATQGTPYLAFQSTNSSGVPIKALLISYTSAANGANAMSANVYIYDSTAEAWLSLTANVPLAVNSLTSVAIPAPIGHRSTAQSLSVYVQIANVATANGDYTFGLSAGM